jgi:hypothetical protein
MYVTADGKTHAHVSLTVVSGLDLALYLYKSDTSTLTVDWGDGSQTTFTNTGGFNTGAHTYASYGDREITLWISSGSGTYALGSGAAAASFVGGTVQVQRGTLIRLHLGSNATGFKTYGADTNVALEYVTMPQEVTTIEGAAFRTCYMLQALVFPTSMGTALTNATCQNCISLKEAVIPTSVTTIGPSVFFYNHGLRRCIIPSGVTSISGNAFVSCLMLRDVGPLPTVGLALGTDVFNSCHELEFPDGLILDSVYSLGTGNIFNACRHIASVDCQNATFTSIPAACFAYCNSLTEIILPDTLTTISKYAFSNIRTLRSITIPASVTSIGTNAFATSPNLVDIAMLPTTPPTLGANSFVNIGPQAKIYVPDASVDAYKAATNWITYANYIFPISEM